MSSSLDRIDVVRVAWRPNNATDAAACRGRSAAADVVDLEVDAAVNAARSRRLHTEEQLRLMVKVARLGGHHRHRRTSNHQQTLHL